MPRQTRTVNSVQPQADAPATWVRQTHGRRRGFVLEAVPVPPRKHESDELYATFALALMMHAVALFAYIVLVRQSNTSSFFSQQAAIDASTPVSLVHLPPHRAGSPPPRASVASVPDRTVAPTQPQARPVTTSHHVVVHRPQVVAAAHAPSVEDVPVQPVTVPQQGPSNVPSQAAAPPAASQGGAAGNGQGGSGGGSGSGGGGGGGGGGGSPGERVTSTTLYDNWTALGVAPPPSGGDHTGGSRSWQDLCKNQGIDYATVAARSLQQPVFTGAGNPDHALGTKTGMMRVQVTITPGNGGGPVYGTAQIVRSTGDRDLDSVGQYIASHTMWLPALNHGVPVPYTVEYDIIFASANNPNPHYGD